MQQPVKEFRATLTVGTETWPITAVEQVGSCAACSIFIDKPSVSRLHCLLYSNGDKVTIQNLGSERKISLNSQEMLEYGKVTLTTKTVIKIGEIYGIISFKKATEKSTSIQNGFHQLDIKKFPAIVNPARRARHHLQHTTPRPRSKKSLYCIHE